MSDPYVPKPGSRVRITDLLACSSSISKGDVVTVRAAAGDMPTPGWISIMTAAGEVAFCLCELVDEPQLYDR